ncbi:hypothetical protein CBS101457_003845 [Exobasidium rhododendri]|nr:hypothetical protein CBS101457_003845 [Exobasidium rhododendri]
MECLSHISTLLTQITNSGNVELGRSTIADQNPYDILCLGSGWTYSFLGPAAAEAGFKTTFTSREAKAGGYKFTFDPESDEIEAFKSLPDARNIVIIFPLYSPEAVKRLVGGYLKTREGYEECREECEKIQSNTPRFILLGSTGIWNNEQTFQFVPLSDGKSHINEKSGPYSSVTTKSTVSSPWKDRHSDTLPLPRAIAENALLSLNEEKNMVQKEKIPTSVLCLSGLWGHGRSFRRYISVIASTREKLEVLKSVHLVHGHDVARAILAMVNQWEKTEAQRWLLTNERVYDLWDLCSRWGNGGEAGRDHAPQGPQPGWVQELITESRSTVVQHIPGTQLGHPSTAIRSLPRTVEQLGNALDGTDFWSTFGISPDVPWVD